jgi:outer membrane autotransporter protein
MIKSVFAATAALSVSAGAAFAGPYVNIESNSGYTGTDFDGSVLETHVGYENALGENGSWYVQGGPALQFPDGSDTSTELSGKVGASFDVTENTNIYGEISAATNNEIDLDEAVNVGVKAGVKYSF